MLIYPGISPAFFDRIAALTKAGDVSLSEVRSVYEEEPGMKPPPVVKSHSPAAVESIEVRLRKT